MIRALIAAGIKGVAVGAIADSESRAFEHRLAFSSRPLRPTWSKKSTSCRRSL
ncbi:hypothetical protein X732_30615 [Mesorhizobium sp. L2C066B000]|nr:hypothetical protein X732_30615 [Mesorhizobium sp. L2C066B000]